MHFQRGWADFFPIEKWVKRRVYSFQNCVVENDFCQHISNTFIKNIPPKYWHMSVFINTGYDMRHIFKPDEGALVWRKGVGVMETDG